VFLVMFDRSDGIRFIHAPSGGGDKPAVQTTNPAWDFQFIVPRYEVLRDYGFGVRAVYRGRCTRQEIVQAFATWRKSIGRQKRVR
jgi:hypothetical protein